ncbi:hypothetical protein HCJ40_07255 [Listeria sp. FSL L7-0993]|uniref:hypothetical protein n=1 Tax=Listeria cossartiae TaxID=2838249 RepID=UPI001627E2AD|nr:hypothetical protein [Listeria cossartiae]MBC1806823.1 hypothetical protein [Listeria cossartiae subsp. cayugensis]
MSKIIEETIFTLTNQEQIIISYNDEMSDDALKTTIINKSQPIHLLLELGIFDKEDLTDKFPGSEIIEILYERTKLLLIKDIQLDSVHLDEVLFIFRLLANSNFLVHIISGYKIDNILHYSQKDTIFKRNKVVGKIELHLDKDEFLIMSDYDGSSVIILSNEQKC